MLENLRTAILPIVTKNPAKIVSTLPNLTCKICRVVVVANGVIYRKIYFLY